MSLLKVTVVRHGNTDANNEGWIQGQMDTPLNENGLSQAKACGERLKDEVYDHVYCSDLSRCRKTLEGILMFQPDLKIDYLTSLRERGFGTLSGQKFKQVFKSAKRQQIDFDIFVHNHQGETTHEFQKRSFDAWESILQDATQRNFKSILIVSHGGVIRNFTEYWLLNDYRPAQEGVKIEAIAHRNTAVSVVDPTHKLVYEFNSIDHLKHQSPDTSGPLAI